MLVTEEIYSVILLNSLYTYDFSHFNMFVLPG